MANHIKKIIFIVSLGCVLLLITGISFNVFINQKTEDLRKLKENSSFIDESNTSSLKQSVNRLKKDLEKVESYFIDHNDAVGFISRLEEIALKSGLEINIENLNVEEKFIDRKSIENGEPKTEKIRSYGELFMNISSSGSWQSTMTFLATLEQLNKKVTVSDLRLSVNVDSGTGATTWHSVFNLRGLTN